MIERVLLIALLLIPYAARLQGRDPAGLPAPRFTEGKGPRDIVLIQAPQAPSPQRLASGGVPNPPAVSISPLRAAAFGAAIICGLLLLQYAHRRKPFILLWASGWLLIVPALLVMARSHDNVRVGREPVGLSQFLAICTATLYFWSGDVYRQTGYARMAHVKALVAIASYFLLAPLAFAIEAVLVPGYILSATMLAGAGAMSAAVLIERRMIGAGLIAFVLFGLAVSNLASAFVVRRMVESGQFIFDILIVNVVLYACGAMGIHLLIFEDMTYELRMTNRLEAARAELLEASITDPLTGCHNRRFLDQVITMSNVSQKLKDIFITTRLQAVFDTYDTEALNLKV